MPEKSKISRFSDEVMHFISYIHRHAHITLKNNSDALIKGQLTMPQYVALEMVNVRGPLKMKDIAKALHVSLPAVTGLINRLVKLRFVKRTYDANDRRLIVIELTPEGKRIAERTSVGRRKMIEEIFSCLSDKERSDYLHIISKIKRSLHEKSKKT